MKNITTKIILVVFIITISVSIIYKISSNNIAEGNVLKSGYIFNDEFEAVDHNGSKFTNENLNGKYKLIFFGFTSCPAICPNELGKLTNILNRLNGDELSSILPVFITVDPERDNPDKIKKYLEMFHSNITGITGTPDQINNIVDIYKAHTKRIDIEEMNTYMFDHSTHIYFIDPNNKLISLYKMTEKPDDIVMSIRKKL